jgi:hypothetical protein
MDTKQRDRILARDGGECHYCGKMIPRDQRQIAHRIANTDTNRTAYGDKYVDHDFNLVTTCSLYCNGRMNIGNKPAIAQRLIDLIDQYDDKQVDADEISRFISGG